MNLEPGDTGHRQIAALGIYESELTDLIVKLAVEEGGLLLDVGANYGYYSLLWCGLNPNNRSKAIEASPRVALKLQENIALNGMEKRIEVLEWAATDTEGFISFNPGPADQTGWGGIANGEATGTMIEVPAHRLDALMPRVPITFMKIDCEGADALVLEGARGLLERKLIRHICFEENAPRMDALRLSAGTASRVLRELGYQCVMLQNGETLQEFHAWI